MHGIKMVGRLLLCAVLITSEQYSRAKDVLGSYGDYNGNEPQQQWGSGSDPVYEQQGDDRGKNQGRDNHQKLVHQKMRKLLVPDRQIPQQAVVQVQCGWNGQCGICAGVLISSTVVFTSKDCTSSRIASEYYIYLYPKDDHPIQAFDYAEHAADGTVLLQLDYPVKICRLSTPRNLGVIHWKIMSEIYIRRIRYDKSTHGVSQNTLFVEKVLKNWNELAQADYDAKYCRAANEN